LNKARPETNSISGTNLFEKDYSHRHLSSTRTGCNRL
jgi:hypothetical protein